MDPIKKNEQDSQEPEPRQLEEAAEVEELTDDDLENVAGGWDGDPGGGG